MSDEVPSATDTLPGYRSRKHRQRYLPLMTILLIGAFLAQAILPVVVYAAGARYLRLYGSWQFHPLYFDMVVWQDAFWYPTWGYYGGCTLSALDFQGKPLHRPELRLPGQFHEFVADGDRLWAVHNREVVEIHADGSQPRSASPKRFINHPNPFLWNGKLVAVDWDYQSPLAMYVFEKGEWKLEEELLVGSDIPADALNPNSRQSDQLSASRQIEPIPFVDAFNHFEVVPSAETYFAVCSYSRNSFHRANLPFSSLDISTTQPESWVATPSLGLNPLASAFTTVAGDLALLKSSSDKTEIQLWRYTNDTWAESAHVSMRVSGGLSRLSAFTTPDGSRSFAIFEFLDGRANDLMELFTDRMEKVADLGNSRMTYHPPESAVLGVVSLAFVSPFVVMFLFVLLATPLMQSHRDPCYFKGPLAVKFATLWRRCLASLVDCGLWIGPIAAGWIAGWRLWNPQLFNGLNNGNPNHWFYELIPGLLATAGWTAVFAFANWLMLARGGFTIGKLLCGVRVVRTSLESPGLMRSLFRLTIWPIETGMFSGVVAFSLIAFTHNRQRLADLIAGCVVLDAASLRHGLAGRADISSQGF